MDTKPHLAMVIISNPVKLSCWDISSPKNKRFSKETKPEPCKVTFLSMSLMAVPINRFVCFPKSAARRKVAADTLYTEAFRGSKV